MPVLRTKRNPIRDSYKLHVLELRLKLGMSQLEFARKSGLKKLSIASYELGYHEPGLQTLVQMAVGLGLTSLDELVTFDRDKIAKLVAGDEPSVDNPAAEIVKIEVPPEPALPPAIEISGSAPKPVASGDETSTGGSEGIQE